MFFPLFQQHHNRRPHDSSVGRCISLKMMMKSPLHMWQHCRLGSKLTTLLCWKLSEISQPQNQRISYNVRTIFNLSDYRTMNTPASTTLSGPVSEQSGTQISPIIVPKAPQSPSDRNRCRLLSALPKTQNHTHTPNLATRWWAEWSRSRYLNNAALISRITCRGR